MPRPLSGSGHRLIENGGRRLPCCAVTWVLLLTGTGCASGGERPPQTRPTVGVAAAPSGARSATPVPSSPGDPSTSTAEHRPAHNGDDLPPGLLQGNLGVADQHGDGSQVLLSAEIDGSDGWVVIQADEDGRRGELLGLVHRRNEAHDDTVVVPLRRQIPTSRLWVTLYVDAGKPGVFDDPGADTPVQFAGQDLSRKVTLTVP